MEDRRIEAREMLKEEEERKEEAKKRKESYALLRVSLDFLKQREDKWRIRRIDECERIKEEDKKDRLACCKEKKKRYGMKKLSKEENLRLNMRKEER